MQMQSEGGITFWRRSVVDMDERREARIARVVTPYVRDRLVREKKHGYYSEVARRTGFTSQHVSKIASGNANVGADFAEALVDVWGFKSLDALIAEAERDYEARTADIAPVDKLTALRVLAAEEGISPERVKRHVEEAALSGRAEWTVRDHLEEMKREEAGTASTSLRDKDRKRSGKADLDAAATRPSIKRRSDR